MRHNHRRTQPEKPLPTRQQSIAQDLAGGEIILYQTPDGAMALDVRLEHDTLWLNQKQMSELFATERSVITKHLRNIFNSGELDKNSVCAFFAHTAEDGKTYQVAFYNLDVAISVGYRVNSRRGTQFRIWATNVLRDHIVKGYSTNAKRLADLQQTIRLVARVADRRALRGDEATALLRVVREYDFALEVLDHYDHGRLPSPSRKAIEAQAILPQEARQIVKQLGVHFGGSGLFGREKDGSLESSLAAVFQTIGGQDAYPGIEEKAAHLLYFLVKNHPFVDGNKRIAAALFLWFLEKNDALVTSDSDRRISEEALVALTLLIAESDPCEKATIVRLATCLLEGAANKADENA